MTALAAREAAAQISFGTTIHHQGGCWDGSAQGAVQGMMLWSWVWPLVGLQGREHALPGEEGCWRVAGSTVCPSERVCGRAWVRAHGCLCVWPVPHGTSWRWALEIHKCLLMVCMSGIVVCLPNYIDPECAVYWLLVKYVPLIIQKTALV